MQNLIKIYHVVQELCAFSLTANGRTDTQLTRRNLHFAQPFPVVLSQRRQVAQLAGTLVVDCVRIVSVTDKFNPSAKQDETKLVENSFSRYYSQQKYCIMFQMNLIRFLKMFSYVFLYKSLQRLAQVNRTWLTLIVGYV